MSPKLTALARRRISPSTCASSTPPTSAAVARWMSRPGRECLQQALVARQVSHDAKFDLRIVGGDEPESGRRHERLADAPPLGGADGNVLEVGRRRREPAGRGDGLVVAGVHPPGRGAHTLGQGHRVGGAELGEGPVVEDDAGQRKLPGQLLKHRIGRRRLAGRGAGPNRNSKPVLVEEESPGSASATGG